MPPRIPAQSLSACAESTSRCCASATAPRYFSSTPARCTVERNKFYAWLNKEGQQLRSPKKGEPNYLARDRPFPDNPHFKSKPVLSEESREMLWRKVMQEAQPIKAVSAEYGVDMRRVAAVARLKEVEKSWVKRGKRLATPYSQAVMDMLPTYTLQPNADPSSRAFEPINEIHVHGHTMQQIFKPASESRNFTRKDAAKTFNEAMRSADERVPHPELIHMEKRIMDGMNKDVAFAQFKKAAEESEAAIASVRQEEMIEEQERTKRVDSDRFEFRFKDINSEDVGKDGRSRNGTGWRYGVPFYDRKRGQIKIPTEVV